jgi:hypothetical protein
MVFTTADFHRPFFGSTETWRCFSGIKHFGFGTFQPFY